MTKKFFRKIYTSLRRIYSEIESINISWFRDRTALFFTFLYPVLFILVFGAVFGGESEYNMYYLNEDLDANSAPYPQVSDLLANIEESIAGINLEEVEFNSSQITPEQWIIENQIRALLFIPAGWSANITDPSPSIKASVEYYYDPTYTSSLALLELIDKAVQKMNSEIVGVSTIIDIETTTTPGREGLTMIDFYVPGIIGITISTSGMIGLVNLTIAEKYSGILYKKSSTPLKKWEWALAKEIWQVVFGLAVSTVTIIAARLAFGFHFSMLHPLMLLFIIFGSMTFAGIGLIFTRLIKNPDAVTSATMAFTFPQMFLAGAMFPVEIMPTFLVTISKIFPLHYMAEGMRNLMLPSTFDKVWLNLGITAAMGVVFFVVGVIIADWKKE